jgi:FkbM family methyltransferase
MLKKLLKTIIHTLSIDLTKNIRYDRLTFKIINKHLKKDAVCIDIGCHLGEILEVIIKKAPHDNHYAFEPLPKFYQKIKNKYKANIYPYALSDKTGEVEFNYVENSPEYSGINKRNYLGLKNPKISLIKVKLEKLDNIIPLNKKIDFIKIDVEGAEYNVLLGGRETILRSKPLIVFEFEKGSTEFYNVTPAMMFDLLKNEYKMDLYTLNSFLKNNSSLERESFIEIYEKNEEIYFLAKPQIS